MKLAILLHFFPCRDLGMFALSADFKNAVNNILIGCSELSYIYYI
jgi:hypothetical protein